MPPETQWRRGLFRSGTDSSVRTAKDKKVLKPLRFQDFLWQRVKDSNPHIQSQSLLCYLYTNPLYLSAAANRYYYTEKELFVNRI